MPDDLAPGQTWIAGDRSGRRILALFETDRDEAMVQYEHIPSCLVSTVTVGSFEAWIQKYRPTLTGQGV